MAIMRYPKCIICARCRLAQKGIQYSGPGPHRDLSANHLAVARPPLRDVDPRVLTRSDTHTYCPYKGEAGYYNVTAAGATVPDAIWTYEQPYPAVADIAGHVAFYPAKVEFETF